jgi:hypothetical protein
VITALTLDISVSQEVSYRQSDKIIALRSVAKALECENELLSRENGRQTKSRDENGGNQVSDSTEARVARFFMVQTYQNGKNIPNDHKLYQTAINYTKWP